jgi:hypothetical protein
MNNEDKTAWCEYGLKLEHQFLARGYPVTLNDKKETDKYCHDFFIHLPCDLKSIKTRWEKSEELFGIPSDYAVSINQKDLQRYNDLYPNLVMILDVEWSGVYLVPVSYAIKLIKNGYAKKHEYKNRKNDMQGNAKISWIFDIREFEVIKETKDA